jgi:exodeoxyribonuclease VII small subunit
MKFEEALNKLEDIVDKLEHQELNLDEALNLYEEGIKLVKFCNKKLSEIERKIEVLVKDEEGKLIKKEISEEEILDKDYEDK